VRIDIQGVPPRTDLTVDGHPSTFPLELPRGTRSHRIVLKPPGAPEKVLEVDGTRDRLIELVFEAPPRRGEAPSTAGAGEGAHERATRTSEKRESRRTSAGAGSARERGEKKPAAGASDREAITDI
jgi:hypothetical protein